MIDFDGSAEIKIEPTKEAQIEFDKIEIDTLKHTLSVYEEVIDSMAEDISFSNLTNWECGCNYEIKECECMKGPIRKCEDCIKEYYVKKVRSE